MKTLCPITEKTTFERCIFECVEVSTKTLFKSSPRAFDITYAAGTLKALDGNSYKYDGMPIRRGLYIRPGKYFVTVKFDNCREIISVDYPFNGSDRGQESLQ